VCDNFAWLSGFRILQGLVESFLYILFVGPFFFEREKVRQEYCLEVLDL